MSMVALIFQALFLAHGGLTTLGANTLTLGVFGGLAGYGVFHLSRRLGMSLFWAGMLAGTLGDLAIHVGTSIQLALALHGDHSIAQVFWAVMSAFAPTQVILAPLEGVFTGMLLRGLCSRLLSQGICLAKRPACGSG